MNRPDKLKLLVVDDHAVVREGLEAMLGMDPLFESVTTRAEAVSRGLDSGLLAVDR